MYIIDTNTISFLFKGGEKSKAVSFNMNQKTNYTNTNFYISAITYMEIMSGIEIAKAKIGVDYKNEEFANIINFINKEVITISFGSEIAKKYSSINAILISIGKTISMPDLMIGSTAAEMGYILVTNNTKDFINIPNLALEDWSK